MTENFYIILELDPNIDDEEIIKKAILAKKDEWSRMRNHPTQGTQANQYLGLLPRIRRVMENPEDRRKEAQEAVQILGRQQKEKFKELDDTIKLFLFDKDFIYQNEFEDLKKRTGLSESEIKARLKVTIKPNKTESQSKDEIKPIEASLIKAIEKDLSILNKKDLYEFLDLTSTSSIKVLLDKTNEKDGEIKKRAAKDASVTAAGSLLGHCINIFKSEDKRKSYDKALEILRLNQLNKTLDIFGLDGIITVVEFKKLLEEGTKIGSEKSAVNDHIINYARNKKWALEKLPPAELEALNDCGICGSINKPSVKHCTNCGSALLLQCPACKTENRSTTRACSKCGFSIGDMPNALPLIRNAKDALVTGNFAEAERLYNQAELYWSDNPDILEGKKRLQASRGQVETQLALIQEQAQKNLYYSAQSELLKLPAGNQGDPRVEALRNKVEQNIQGAELLIRRSRSAGSSREKEELLIEALNQCQDCKEAEHLLAQLPPEPPTGLIGRADSNLVSLRWDAVPSKEKLNYRIVRKERSAPSHAQDGEFVGETEQTHFQDASCQTGVSYFFSVYSLRRGVLSSQGRVSEALTTFSDIENLQLIPGNGRVALQWQAPLNMSRVEVWTQKNNPPSRRGEGELVPASQLTGANHERLINDEMYGYLVVAVFKDTYGKEIYAPGVQVVGEPTAPPEPIKNLRLTQNDELVELQWQPVGTAQVDIYYAETPFTCKSGEVVQIEYLKKHGHQIIVARTGYTTFRVAGHGVYHVLPVTVKGSLAIAGQAGYIAYLEEVSNLTGMVLEDTLRLEWQFPAGAKRVHVSYGTSLEEKNLEVSETDYQKERACVIQFPFDFWEITVVVKTIVDTPAGPVYSQGVKTSIRLRKTKIQFQITRKTNFWFSGPMKFSLSIVTDGLLPGPLILVAKEHNKLISYKDLDRAEIMLISRKNFEYTEFNTDFEYKPSSKSVKQVFFSLIPQDPNGKDEMNIEDNGKKIIV